MSESSASQAGPPSSEAGFQVIVNGDPLRVDSTCTVAGLLEIVELAGKRVAVAVNREVVLRGQYADARLTEGDRIEILEAVGGG